MNERCLDPVIRHLQRGRAWQAQRLLVALSAQHPHEGLVDLYLGLCRMEAGAWAEACDCFESALRKEDDLPSAHLLLGLCYLELALEPEDAPQPELERNALAHLKLYLAADAGEGDLHALLQTIERLAALP